MNHAIETKRKRRWRLRTWISTLSGLIIVVSLLYWDQVALLYILSTLALTVLMVVVAFSNLEDREEELPNLQASTGGVDRGVTATDSPPDEKS